ncbi:NAD(P)-dependent dehydrogenase (short-subunit alcohol dehydrogenase family) [Saonia flava]|uniref:NAD(P)-dependent dehydrogenase (Short-subunit alcohol dehydrogenase family) n=1 Tax=Saonia flava TaxID=523696 RepID=A0A846QUY5_9FLAO|nr:SDR family oxidoreductase [Saonia flava]NJB70372.1 NAD(P)-dependent dehydrogenase (short-subunit alcohol dehydrogenase family) [Saonia flava]
MERLENKVAIITGGGGGIGKTTAKLFIQQGGRVMLVGHREESLKKAVKELKSPNVSYCIADVSKKNDTQKYVEKTLEVFGKIDIFFNNAGVEGITKPISEYPEEIFDKVIAINLKGVWLGCKYVLPKMSDGGSVIITSSIAGLKGFTGMVAYAASKHGVIGIMRVAALESADRNIRVNTIHPGPVNTQMMRRIETDISPDNAKEVQKGFENSVPLGRYAEANEIAELTLFLASDESKYITGSTYVIDGGMAAS